MPSVTRNPSKRRSARRAAVVAGLLEVVEELLDAGELYTDISVERLITAAGISRSTFYVYFEDKGALLLALAEDVVAKLVDTASGWWELPPDATRQDVEQALRQIMEVYRAHDAMWQALVDAAAYDPNVRASFHEIVGLASSQLARHIREGQKAGSVRPDLDPRRTADWLTWMTERGHHQLAAGATKAELTKLAKAQSAIVWYTLYEGAPGRS
ncbi:TetR family transcriptional regulator [Conexibacter sp. W3-3-2]|nr:TetR family transcriptional regulator [Conexibacter sp. W3-3-2]